MKMGMVFLLSVALN